MSKKTTKQTGPNKAAAKKTSASKAKAAAKESGKDSGKESGKPGPQKKPESSKQPDQPVVDSNDQQSGNSRALLMVLLLAIVLGGGIATQSLWSPYIIDYLPGLKQPTGMEPAQDSLVERINKIEEEIQWVRQGGDAIADLERERNAMNQSFEGVMTQIVDLEKQIASVRQMLQATTPPKDAAETNESLLRLRLRMNKLEASDETVNVVMKRLAKLEQAMADSDADVSTSAEQLSQTMAGISQRIGSLEAGAAQSSTGDARAQQQVHAQTLVLAVGHLRETLRSSFPFEPALGALQVLGQDDPDIMRGVEELAPHAKVGIATLDMLRREFVSTADAINAAAPQQGGPSEAFAGAVDNILNKIKSLVSVRKAGSLATNLNSQSPLGKAMAQLDEGNLGGAVIIVGELTGPQAAAAAPWLERARARLMAEMALSRLQVFAVSLLASDNKGE